MLGWIYARSPLVCITICGNTAAYLVRLCARSQESGTRCKYIAHLAQMICIATVQTATAAGGESVSDRKTFGKMLRTMAKADIQYLLTFELEDSADRQELVKYLNTFNDGDGEALRSLQVYLLQHGARDNSVDQSESAFDDDSISIAKMEATDLTTQLLAGLHLLFLEEQDAPETTAAKSYMPRGAGVPDALSPKEVHLDINSEKTGLLQPEPESQLQPEPESQVALNQHSKLPQASSAVPILRPDSKVYVATQPLALSTAVGELKRFDSTSLGPVAIWSAGMNEWVTVKAIDDILAPTHQVEPVGFLGLVLKMLHTLLSTVLYVVALIFWSLFELTPSSAVLAAMAAFITWKPSLVKVPVLLAALQVLALVQWMFGIFGITVHGDWGAFFHTWSVGAREQQLIAWGTMLVVGCCHNVDMATPQPKQAQIFHRVQRVSRTCASMVLVVSGLFLASFVNFFYTLVGVIALVARTSSIDSHGDRLLTVAFLASVLVICIALPIYIIPAEVIQGRDGSDTHDSFTRNWNAWLTITGLRGCAQVKELSIPVEQSLDCKFETFGRSYAVICSVGLHLWLQRFGQARDRSKEQRVFKPLLERSLPYRVMLRSALCVLVTVTMCWVSSSDSNTIPDFIMVTALLLFLPFYIADRCSHRIVFYCWCLPCATVFAIAVYQYATTMQQVECIVSRAVLSDDIKEACAVVFKNNVTDFGSASLGSCHVVDVRACLDHRADLCVRTAKTTFRPTLQGLTRVYTNNSMCVLTASELGLESSTDASNNRFVTNLKVLSILFMYAFTAVGFYNGVRLQKSCAEDHLGRNFARAVRKRLSAKFLRVVIWLHTGGRVLYITFVFAAPSLLTMLVFFVSQLHTSCISAGYWLLALLMVVRPARALSLWLPLMIYSSICYLAQYTFQFEFMADVRDEHSKLAVVIGLHRTDNRWDFNRFTCHLLVVLMTLVLKRLVDFETRCYCEELVFCGTWSVADWYKTKHITVHIYNKTNRPVKIQNTSGDVLAVLQAGAAPHVQTELEEGEVLLLEYEVPRRVLTIFRTNIVKHKVVVGCEKLQFIDVTVTSIVGPLFCKPDDTILVDGLRLPLPPSATDRHAVPLGAWPQLTPEEVQRFGRFAYLAYNAGTVYGSLIRWVGLLIAATTLPYSLSMLYIISLAEMLFGETRLHQRAMFSRVVLLCLACFHTATVAAMVLNQAKMAGTIFPRVLDELIKGLVYLTRARDEADSILHTDATVDVQSVFVLLIGFTVLACQRRSHGLVQACQDHFLKEAPAPLEQQSGALTKAVARLGVLRGVTMIDALRKARAKASAERRNEKQPARQWEAMDRELFVNELVQLLQSLASRPAQIIAIADQQTATFEALAGRLADYYR
jgi:hypothetical protein